MPRRMDVKNRIVKLCTSYAPRGMDDIFKFISLISAQVPHRTVAKNKKIKKYRKPLCHVGWMLKINK